MARGPCGDGERSAEDRLLPSSALPHLKQPPTFSVCLAPRCCFDLHPMSMRCTRCGARKGTAGWSRTSPGHEIRKRPLAGQTNGRRKPLASKCWRAGSQSGKEACQARGTFKRPDLSQTGESPDRDALAPHRCTPPGNKEAPLIRTRWGASVWTTPQRSALGEGSEGHGQRCTRPRSWSTNPALQKPNTEPVTSKKREGASDECLAPSLDRPTRCGMQWARHRNGPDRGLVRKVTFSSAAIAR